MKLSIMPLETVLHGPDGALQSLLAQMKLHIKAAGPTEQSIYVQS